MIQLKKLVIIGGSGFLGQVICQTALTENWTIVSISKHGRPPSNKLLKSLRDAPIEWVQADIFTSQDWQAHLLHAFAIIDLVGIIKERPKEGITYQKMIADSAKIIGTVASDNDRLQHFIFLSANAGPTKYIEAKRQAEQSLISMPLPLTIIRPGLIVGAGRPSSIRAKWALEFLLKIPLLSVFVTQIKPISVDTIVKKILAILLSPEPLTTRVLAVDDLDNLAD